MFEHKVKLQTLIQLISFIKFESREYESRYFAASPIVGEILSDLKIEFNSGEKALFQVEKNTPFGRTLINAIKWHLEQTDEWNEMSLNDRIEHIKNLASPYLLKNEELDFLLKYKEE